MTRSKTATLWELDCILHRVAKLADSNFTIFPPSDKEGNLSVDETIELYKQEIIKTINQIKTEQPHGLYGRDQRRNSGHAETDQHTKS